MKTENYIVIPTYDRWVLTNRLLLDLAEYEMENIDNVIIVDNGSTDLEIPKGIDWWQTHSSLPIQLERIEHNIGFTLASNYGLRLATGELAQPRIIYLISNDVRINGRFIKQAEDILLGAKRALVGNRYINWDSGWNQFSGVVYDYLEGYFLACTSDGWRDLDYFDEEFAPADYEDVAISTIAKRKGYQLVSLNNPTIVHKGAGTYGYTEERRRITERNRGIFSRKYAGVE